MTREVFIERALRQIYGGQPTDDSVTTVNLVNTWLPDAIAVAAKQNYTDAIKLDGVGYVNNSFYTTFKNISATKDEKFIYKLTLPEIPVGIGKTDGISALMFKDDDGNLSFPCTPLSQNERGFYKSMRPIPNKILYFPEGKFLYAISSLPLNNYTANVTMISGGDSSDLTSELNVPPDYFPAMTEYIKAQLLLERQQVPDQTNDGTDRK